MTRLRHAPERMCVGCGQRAPQVELLRFVAAPAGGLAIVRAGGLHRRSAYLHRRRDCWERFAGRKGPLRSLGCSVDRAGRAALVQELIGLGTV